MPCHALPCNAWLQLLCGYADKMGAEQREPGWRRHGRRKRESAIDCTRRLHRVAGPVSRCCICTQLSDCSCCSMQACHSCFRPRNSNVRRRGGSRDWTSQATIRTMTKVRACVHVCCAAPAALSSGRTEAQSKRQAAIKLALPASAAARTQRRHEAPAIAIGGRTAVAAR